VEGVEGVEGLLGDELEEPEPDELDPPEEPLAPPPPWMPQDSLPLAKAGMLLPRTINAANAMLLTLFIRFLSFVLKQYGNFGAASFQGSCVVRMRPVLIDSYPNHKQFYP
jgi:hypothetical protein